METIKKDPLLITAKVMTIIMRVALTIGMIGLGIGMAGVAIASLGWLPDSFVEQLTIDAGQPVHVDQFGIVLLPMLGAMIALSLSYKFVALLAQMIDTVGQGDPFTFANAARLTQMAWLAVAVEVAGFFVSLTGEWVERRFDAAGIEGSDLGFNSDISLTGIALAVVLFILARVFREGARMRAELEGTV